MKIIITKTKMLSFLALCVMTMHGLSRCIFAVPRRRPDVVSSIPAGESPPVGKEEEEQLVVMNRMLASGNNPITHIYFYSWSTEPAKPCP
mmetsp:Transcript_14454/g.23919  ORF Transcript_14454/g.23919 Transcript_14454/m.23919 type:complete len:90 (-) Transcript_14454:1489-1758(-)